VMDSGGYAYAKNAMKSYQEKAFSYLGMQQEGVYKDSLINLVKFTTERNN
jgi:geranylgeranyl pyrophosphate synthase